MVPYSTITMAEMDSPAHRALAEKVADESIVLLKNDGLLPLNRDEIERIAVIGPNAAADRMLSGNYTGKQSNVVTILDGIKAIAGPNIAITYAKGCDLALRNDQTNAQPPR